MGVRDTGVQSGPGARSGFLSTHPPPNHTYAKQGPKYPLKRWLVCLLSPSIRTLEPEAKILTPLSLGPQAPLTEP